MRLPLQMGSSALASLTRASATFVPAVIIFVAGFALFIELDVDVDVVAYILVGIPAAGMLLSLKNLRRAKMLRPSDLELDDNGFTVYGGPHDGLKVLWPDVQTVEVIDTKADADLIEDPMSELTCVQLKRKNGPKLLIAGTEKTNDTERASLVDVAKTLSASADKKDGAPVIKNAPASLFTCPECNAAIPPADAANVKCPFCDAKVAVPAELSKKVRDSAVANKDPARIVSILVKQPGSGFVGALYSLAALFMLVAWPVALGLIALNVYREAFTWLSTLALLLFVFSCIGGLFALIRGRLVDRQALRMLTLRFRAHAGPKGLVCRDCGAPLPEGAPQSLVSCTYCKTANILAVDLSERAAAVREEDESLEDALSRRNADRRKYRGYAWVGVVLIATSAFGLKKGYRGDGRIPEVEMLCLNGDQSKCDELGRTLAAHDYRTVPTKKLILAFRKWCETKDADACAGYARLISNPLSPIHVSDALQEWKDACRLGQADACQAAAYIFENEPPKNEVRAREYQQKGCELGSGNACMEYGYSLNYMRGGPKDVPAALAAYERACDKGSPMGCNNLGAMLHDGEDVAKDVPRAMTLFRFACDAGIELGCNNVRKFEYETP